MQLDPLATLGTALGFVLGGVVAVFGWLLKKYAEKTDRSELDGVKTAQLLDTIEKRMADRDKEIERHRATLHSHGDDIQTIMTLHHLKGCDIPPK